MTENIEKKRLLLVDDEANFLKSAKLFFEMEGYEADCALSGSEALTFSESNRYDLIVTDVMMPEIDGFELRKRFRAIDKTSQTPIILLTAKQMTTDDIKALNDNITGFVMKPFDFPMLLKVISELLSRKTDV